MTFLGLSVPIPTLFADDGALDTGRNAKFARTLSEVKVDHLFLLGSLGEFPSVEDNERPRLLENVIESTVGPADVWVGCGAPSTRRAVAFAEDAEGMGATAVVAVPPYYLHPVRSAIERYYRAIHAAVSIPLYAYNIPSLVGTPWTRRSCTDSVRTESSPASRTRRAAWTAWRGSCRVLLRNSA